VSGFYNPTQDLLCTLFFRPKTALFFGGGYLRKSTLFLRFTELSFSVFSAFSQRFLSVFSAFSQRSLWATA
jgi:hypothetical protein